MSHDDLPSGVETLRLFVAECSRDRTGDLLPFGNLLDGPDLTSFQKSLDGLLRAMLAEYTAEKRTAIIAEVLRRSAHKQRLS